MGYYINPPNMDKEVWLLLNGEILRETPRSYADGDGNVIVCLVDNGAFTAAGVAYDQGELRDFTDASDPRPKLYFSVPINKLTADICGHDMKDVIG